MVDDLFLVGYRHEEQVKLGLQQGNTLHALDPQKIPSLEWLMQNVAASDLISFVQNAITDTLPSDTPLSLNGLLNHEAIWAAGVTYKMSEEARERESGNSNVYTRVYNAKRPELFWKALGYECVSTYDKVGIRKDATWSVPEPELTVVINARKEIIGFTIGNDMSSRDIEGENPLYLPQAKVYNLACSLGPRIWLQPQIEAFPLLDIQIEIIRDQQTVFMGVAKTQQLNRTLSDLHEFLVRSKDFRYGVFLMTGTGVVPDDDFTLQAGDVVRIQVDPIGELINTVSIV